MFVNLVYAVIFYIIIVCHEVYNLKRQQSDLPDDGLFMLQ